jgi:hypothetical protein
VCPGKFPGKLVNMEAMDRMREEMLEVKQELKNHKIVYQELLETRRVLEDEKQKVDLAKVRIQNLLAELEDRDRSRVNFTSTPRRAPIGDSDSISQVCVSRERKVLVFKGIDSEDVVEWVDEVRRCIRSKSTAEQLACILEHLQGMLSERFCIVRCQSNMIQKRCWMFWWRCFKVQILCLIYRSPFI